MLVTYYFSCPLNRWEAYVKYYRKCRFEHAKMTKELHAIQKLKTSLKGLKQTPFKQLRGISIG